MCFVCPAIGSMPWVSRLRCPATVPPFLAKRGHGPDGLARKLAGRAPTKQLTAAPASPAALPLP